jgi:hypothetical protein
MLTPLHGKSVTKVAGTLLCRSKKTTHGVCLLRLKGTSSWPAPEIFCIFSGITLAVFSENFYKKLLETRFNSLKDARKRPSHRLTTG